MGQDQRERSRRENLVACSLMEVVEGGAVAAAARRVVRRGHAGICVRGAGGTLSHRTQQLAHGSGSLPHLPTKCVRKPDAAIFVAMPVMFRGMAAKPETGSERLEISAAEFSALTWYGWRPDCSAERVGEQHL